MNILEKAIHTLKEAIRNSLDKLNDDQPVAAVHALEQATSDLEEVSSVVLKLEGRVISLGSIVSEASELINAGKNEDTRIFLNSILDALAGNPPSME